MKGIILLLILLNLIFNVIVSINGQRTDLSSLSILDETEDQRQAKRSGVASFYKTWSLRPRRHFRYMRMTDAGYGSRVIVASGLVRALIAHHNVYGMFGPGRKK